MTDRPAPITDDAVLAYAALSGADADRIRELRERNDRDAEVVHFRDLTETSLLPHLLERTRWKHVRAGADGLGMFTRGQWRMIHSIQRELDGEIWAHVLLSRRDGKMPTWEETRNAWWDIYPSIAGHIIIAPLDEHVNMAEVSHVFGCLTRPRPLPDFTQATRSL